MGKAVIPWRSASEQKAHQGSGAGRLIVEDWEGDEMEVEASSVSATTRQDAGMPGCCVQRKFVPAPIWTEAMLAALKLGVKGGKWHSLIDKVSRLDTLAMGWAQVERNAGAAGVDRMSVERFAQGRDGYLSELVQALRDGSYR